MIYPLTLIGGQNSVNGSQTIWLFARRLAAVRKAIVTSSGNCSKVLSSLACLIATAKAADSGEFEGIVVIWRPDKFVQIVHGYLSADLNFYSI